MKLKAGYKLTEVGLIPQEWDVVAIGDLNPFVTSGSRGWAEFYSERGSPFIRITNLSRESIDLDLSDMKFVNLPKISAEGIRTQLQDHDVLISITADIGIIGYVNSEIPKPAYINQHIALVRFEQDRTNGRYITYFLASEGPQKLFRASTDTGAKAGMSLITVKKIRLALPPLPEQNLIATALSDVDALIAALDKLIAKKRLIKQGAMQQLLTGRTRLPGFNGKWEPMKLGEIAEITKLAGFEYTNYFNSYRDGGDIIVIRGTNITNNRLDLSDIKTIPRSTSNSLQRSKLQKGDLVFAYVGTIGPIYLIDENDKYHLGPNTARITVKSDLNPRFVFWYFCSSLARSEINEHISVGAQPSLSMSKIRSFRITLPPSSEQRAIANILSDMDTEIDALEQRRDKTSLLKQGMMQELLTGRIRLVS